MRSLFVSEVLICSSCPRFAEFIEGSPHLTEGEVMEYSHWEYNTDDDDDDEENDLYTDDEEAEAASDINQDEIL